MAHGVCPVIGTVRPFAALPDAVAALASGHMRGKEVVLLRG